MTFGEFLNSKRTEAKITIRRFAELVGISPSFLCDLENSSRPFPAKSRKTPDLLEKMINALNLNEDDAILFKQYAEQSLLLGNRIPNEISEYLKRVPEAQQALRLANEKSLNNEEWEELLKIIKEKK
jgi:transcriptional regulator with XRE-family HTH domain